MTATRPVLAPELEIAAERIPAVVPDSLPLTAAKDLATAGGPGRGRAYLATRLLWERRRFVAVAMARGTVAFLLLAFLLPSRYESKTELMPPDSSSSAVGTLAARSEERRVGKECA